MALIASCRAETDRALYGAGDFGTSLIANGSGDPLLLDCVVRLDQIEDGDWVEREERRIDGCRIFLPFPLPPYIDPIVYEPIDPTVLRHLPVGAPPVQPGTVGFIESLGLRLDVVPLPPGSEIHTGFHAPQDAGRWRLRYTVGLDCGDAAVALEECGTEHSVETPAIGVEAFCPVEECVEEAPVCEGGLDDSMILPVDDVIAPGLAVPECRRDNDTQECRWACAEATPIPPPKNY